MLVEAEDFAKLRPPGEGEEDMLDLAAGARRASRLACQIRLGDALARLTVQILRDVNNMQGL